MNNLLKTMESVEYAKDGSSESSNKEFTQLQNNPYGYNMGYSTPYHMGNQNPNMLPWSQMPQMPQMPHMQYQMSQMQKMQQMQWLQQQMQWLQQQQMPQMQQQMSQMQQQIPEKYTEDISQMSQMSEKSKEINKHKEDLLHILGKIDTLRTQILSTMEELPIKKETKAVTDALEIKKILGIKGNKKSKESSPIAEINIAPSLTKPEIQKSTAVTTPIIPKPLNYLQAVKSTKIDKHGNEKLEITSKINKKREEKKEEKEDDEEEDDEDEDEDEEEEDDEEEEEDEDDEDDEVKEEDDKSNIKASTKCIQFVKVPRSEEENRKLKEKLITGSEEYYKHIKNCIDDAIPYLEGQNYRYKDISANIASFLPWHVWQYGVTIPGVDDYTKRNTKPYTDLKVPRAFIRAQQYALKKGFKLIDISDPEVSLKKVVIMLCTMDRIMTQENKPLWHGLNKLPIKK